MSRTARLLASFAALKPRPSVFEVPYIHQDATLANWRADVHRVRRGASRSSVV